MSIKVINHGKQTFIAICPNCNCEFSYQEEDLIKDRFYNHYVECPDCKHNIPHKCDVMIKDII